MKAIIPVAGYGTRLKPHTDKYQKSLLPVAGKPALDFILEPLFAAGITDITFIVGHFKKQVIDHMKKYNGNFRYIEQTERLGLGHAVLTGLEDSNESVLVQLGDTIFHIDYTEFMESHVNVIGVDPVDDPTRFGIAEVDDNRVINFYEKHPNPPSNLAISGLYYFVNESKLKSAIEYLIKKDIRTKNEYQLTDALQKMVSDGEEFQIIRTPDYFDVGVPDSFLETNRRLLETSHADFPTSKIIEPVFIGKSCTVENSIIGPYVTIMDNCTIKGSKIEDSIILENSTIIDQHIDEKIAAGNGTEVC